MGDPAIIQSRLFEEPSLRFQPAGNCAKLGAAIFAGRSQIREFVQDASLGWRNDVIFVWSN
jgi:hypothetical protein